MEYYFAVVEGPHDAGFVALLLREIGFERVELADDIDPMWSALIPRVFPTSKRLEHVVRYPDMYVRTGEHPRSVAVSVAGGDSRLLSELRAAVEILDLPSIAGLCIIADADENDASHRFDQLSKGLALLNVSHGAGGPEGGASGQPGFPLTLPAAPGEIATGTPKVGIYVLPDNNQAGTLDDILVACAASSIAPFHAPAEAIVAQVDAHGAQGDPLLARLRKPSGRKKATAGIVGNLLYPGSAMSASVEKGPWLQGTTGAEVGLTNLRDFISSWLT